MRKPASAVSALIVLSLAVAGCGSKTADNNAYVKSVSAVQAQTAKDAEKLGTEMSGATTQAQIAQKLDELGTAVKKDAGDLEAIKPPKSVATEHEQYVQLITKFGTDLQDLAGKVKTAKQSDLASVTTEATTITASLGTNEAKILAAINKKLQQ